MTDKTTSSAFYNLPMFSHSEFFLQFVANYITNGLLNQFYIILLNFNTTRTCYLNCIKYITYYSIVTYYIDSLCSLNRIFRLFSKTVQSLYLFYDVRLWQGNVIIIRKPYTAVITQINTISFLLFVKIVIELYMKNEQITILRRGYVKVRNINIGDVIVFC